METLRNFFQIDNLLTVAAFTTVMATLYVAFCNLVA